MAKCEMMSGAGQSMGEFDLPAELFDVPLNPGLVHQVVTAAAAARRAGTHSTLTRSQVRGSGGKPYRQKGTGRARQGTLRSPQMRGGSVTFGPQSRSHARRVPRKMRRAALFQLLSQRCREQRCFVLNEVSLPEGKTRDLLALTKGLQLQETKVLFIVPEKDESLRRAAANLQNVRVALADHLNASIVLDSDVLVMTPPAIDRMRDAYGPKLQARREEQSE